MGILRATRRRWSWLSQRGLVLAGVAALHALAILGLLHFGHRVSVATEAPALQAVFIEVEGREVARPRLEPELEPPPLLLPQLQVPVIRPAQEVTAITVAVVSTPPRSQQAPAKALDPQHPVEVQAVDYLEQVAPRYPPQAKRARAEGTVLLRVIINPDGRPRDVRIERSSGFALLDEAAREAVLKCLFRPHRENGVAHSASAIVPVQFALSGRNG
jgi:protein TonB